MDSMTEDIFPIDILDVMGCKYNDLKVIVTVLKTALYSVDDWLPSISTMFCASSNGSSRSGGTIGVVANKGEKSKF